MILYNFTPNFFEYLLAVLYISKLVSTTVLNILKKGQCPKTSKQRFFSKNSVYYIVIAFTDSLMNMQDCSSQL